MIDKIIGRDPNCFTGADCWNYDYSDRWLLLIGITISLIGIAIIAKKRSNKRRGAKK
jgi:LPXTG-motif cell wall-anchored protein